VRRVFASSAVRIAFVVCALAIASAAPSSAQTPTPPAPKIWTVTASAGAALTSGNSDTSSLNAAYDVVYDPPNRHVVKSDGLALRARTEGELTANRIGVNVRDEYHLTPRLFVFGQNQYLKDEFKSIDYLIAPTGGVGFKVIDTMATQFGVDGSAGGVWEKNPGLDVNASGALAVGQKLTQTLTSNTTLTEGFTGLWKTSDFEDSLFTLGIGIAVAMSTHTQLKLEALDTFKNKPPNPTIQKNDLALLFSFVYKM
jgi:putative salt-induced outer membrane protein YdiY